jgi:exonuclease III
MPLKLSTFNCRGLQDQFKRKKIFNYLRQIESDIIFLQETHCSNKDENFWKTQWGEHAWFSNFTSNSRGVAIFIRKSVPIKFNSLYKDPCGRFLIISLKINNLPFVLVNLYAPNDDDPNFFLDLFTQIDQFDDSNLLIGGISMQF